MVTPKDTPARQDAVKRATFERLFNKAPVEHTLTILLEPQLADASDAAKQALSEAEIEERVYRDHSDKSEYNKRKVALAAAQKAADKAVAAAEEASVEMRFRAIGRLAFDDLVNLHKPGDDDPKDAGWNAKTFPPALVAASLVEPQLSAAEVQQLMDEWNVGEARELFNAAYLVNTARKVVDLGKD